MCCIAGALGAALAGAGSANAADCGGLLQPPCPPPSPPSDGAGQIYGFNDSGLFNSQIPRAQYLGKIDDSGAALQRTGLDWQYYERTQGDFNEDFWAKHDQNYNDLKARGIKQVIVLIGTPYWALTADGKGSSNPNGSRRCEPPTDNRYPQCYAPPDVRDPTIKAAWESFVRKVVSRYPEAAAVEVWNEPNIDSFWFQPQNPELYADLLAATYEAVRQVDADMPVVSGSVSNYTGPNTEDDTAYDSFLRTVYREAGAGSFTALGWHSYPCNRRTEPYAAQLARDVRVVRELKAEFGDTAKPMWLTETGATTGSFSDANCGLSFSETQQRDALGAILDWAKAQNATSHDLPVVITHQLFNSKNRVIISQGSVDGESEFGIVAYSYNYVTNQTTIRDKPAYLVVRCKFLSTC